jgi:RNA polymerase sigma-70 factor (ECF subfamily)
VEPANPLSIPDAKLLRASLGGDLEAFALVQDRYLRSVYEALRLRGLPEADAFEVARETMLRAYTGLAELGGGGTLGSQLHSIASRETIDFGRRRRPTSSLDRSMLEPFDDPRQLAEALWRGAAWLPEDYRDLFWLVHRDGLSVTEVAARTGLSRSVVRTRIHHAYQLLRSLMVPGSVEDEACAAGRAELPMVAFDEELARAVSEGAAAAEHAAGCARCQAELERLRELYALLPGLGRSSSDELERLAGVISASVALLPAPHPESVWPVRWLWVAIAVTVVALGLTVWGVLATPGG